MNLSPMAKTSIGLLNPDMPISLVLGGKPDDPIAFVPGTLRELAAVLAPLMAQEKVAAEVANITPRPGDLVVIRLGVEPTPALRREATDWWNQIFPRVPMVMLGPDSDVTTMRPQGASLRALAEALRPVLREMDQEGSLGA